MMKRVTIIGDGAVAGIHARELAAHPAVKLVSVYAPEREKAVAFAAAHKIATAAESFDEAIAGADVSVICSPSPLHFEQAAACLQAGLDTLIELPPCATAREAGQISALARERRRIVMCAHTSRYLGPYQRVERLISDGVLGVIRQIDYLRHLAPRDRGWVDDALLHHAAHPLDLLLAWFGKLLPVGCVAVPQARQAQSVSLLASLEHGAPVSISVSYDARLPQSRMLIVGDRHTIETDGFSYLRSDIDGVCFTCDAPAAYERAIGDQDAAFIAACCGHSSGVAWPETLGLVRLLDRFTALSGKEDEYVDYEGNKWHE